MNKVYIKLIAVALALGLSVCVVIMSSYAWLVLAGNPVATGIQVTIGGGNTILTALDVTEVGEDGTIYHYPGHFSDKLNFAQQKTYAYLQTVGSLTPVSTYNGVDWFLPAYYSQKDAEVQEGRVPSGQLKDISQFRLDRELAYANLPAEEEDKILEGNYIYLDFWVVSPGGDYILRVSTGEESDGGSFVIDLPQPAMTDGNYKLSYSDSSASAAVRVGFLANDLRLVDDTMLRYRNSSYFDGRFNSLRGLYMEPGIGAVYIDEDRFTIYEPNGDSHPGDFALDGSYVQTKPLALVNGAIVEQSVRDRVSVQRSSLWEMAGTGAGETAIEQIFQTALFAMDTDDMDADEISDQFYGKYLQGQFASYVRKGDFLSNTSNLYSYLNANDGLVPVSQLTEDDLQGATDDIYIIKLEKNVPQRIRMFIWIEGQDVDCADTVDSSRFAVNIEFAGGSE